MMSDSKYPPALSNTEGQRNELIQQYFSLGYAYREIIGSLLCSHGISISLRQLKRHLSQMGLRRKVVESPINDIICAIIHETGGSAKCLGYRAMWKRLLQTYHLNVKRDTVLDLMWLIDPANVQRRKAKRLLRRQYSSPGPNYIWHIDGYDKLKPYGFPIHGAIDGYSRRIMWLHVGITNNHPSVISAYYLNCLEKHGCAPRILRCDHGTENATLKLLQPYFRFNCDDRFAGINSIIVGKSTSNQRIESWWSTYRKQNADWWISYFKDLRDAGVYQDGNPLHNECLKFCFMGVMQVEMDKVVKEWNTHVITGKKNAEGPKSKPDIMYFNPEVYGSQNFGTPVDAEDVKACKELYDTNNDYFLPCMPQFLEIVNEIMPNANKPSTVDEAFHLFVNLTSLLE